MTYSVEDFVRQEQAFYSCPVNSCKTSYTNLMLVVQHLMSRHITVQEGTSVHSKEPSERQLLCISEQGQEEESAMAIDNEQPVQEDNSLERDAQVVHEPKQSMVECEKCGKKFANRWTLKRHALTIHGQKDNLEPSLDENQNQKKNSVCTLCSKVFSSAINLKKHVKVAHEPVTDSKATEEAASELEVILDEDRPAETPNHEASNEVSDDDDPVHIDIKIAPDEILDGGPHEDVPEDDDMLDLEILETVHKEEDPNENGFGSRREQAASQSLPSVICDPASSEEALLSLPSRSEQPSSLSMRSKKDWQCDFCPKIYTHRQTLRNHILTKHQSHSQTGQDLEQQGNHGSSCLDKDKQLACKICHKTFSSRCSHRQHEADIHNLAPRSQAHPDKLQCNFCGSPVDTIEALSGHVKDEHRDMFECSKCNKIAASHLGLKRHKKTCLAKE